MYRIFKCIKEENNKNITQFVISPNENSKGPRVGKRVDIEKEKKKSQ